MTVSSREAFAIARACRALSVALGDGRFERWERLSPDERQQLEDLEWSLLNASGDLRTQAVGLMLDETQASVDDLVEVVAGAREAIRRLDDIRRTIAIATAAFQMFAAVMAKEPAAVARKAKALRGLVGTPAPAP